MPRVFPHIHLQQLRLYDSVECKSVVRHVTIISINVNRRIMPVMKPMAALTMTANPRTELSVGVIEPICYDVGLENWWKGLLRMNFPQLQENLANLLQIPSKMWKPLDSHIHVRRERRFTWKGEELLEGRIHTVIEVPNELVDDVLSISGKHGLIVDFVMRDKEGKKSTRRNVCESNCLKNAA